MPHSHFSTLSLSLLSLSLSLSTHAQTLFDIPSQLTIHVRSNPTRSILVALAAAPRAEPQTSIPSSQCPSIEGLTLTPIDGVYVLGREFHSSVIQYVNDGTDENPVYTERVSLVASSMRFTCISESWLRAGGACRKVEGRKQVKKKKKKKGGG
jgi:hypothetical protein